MTENDVMEGTHPEDARDPVLEGLFAAPAPFNAGETFVQEVVDRTTSLQYRIALALASSLIFLLAVAWLLALPLQEFGVLLVSLMSTPLVEIGDSWLAFMLAPVNNIGGPLVILLKLVRMWWRWIRGR